MDDLQAVEEDWELIASEDAGVILCGGHGTVFIMYYCKFIGS